MKLKLVFTTLLTGCIILYLNSCSEDEYINKPAATYLDLPEVPYDYSGFGNNNNFNNLSTLGRVLFYDQKLSVNNSVSCGSCHLQSLAFSDNVAFSRGFENKLTLRNTLPVQNVQSGRLFWDGRETVLS